MLLSLVPPGSPYVGQRLDLGLPAAQLAELALAGRVGLGNSWVWVADGRPTGDLALDIVLRRLVDEGRAVPAATWVQHQSYLRRYYLDRLVWAGMIQQHTEKLLGFTMARRHHLAPHVQGQMRERIDAVVAGAPGQMWPAARDVALAALVRTVNLDAGLYVGHAFTHAKARLAQLAMHDWTWATVTGAIQLADQLKETERQRFETANGGVFVGGGGAAGAAGGGGGGGCGGGC